MVKAQGIEEMIADYRDELDRLLDGPTYEFSRNARKDILAFPGVFIIYNKIEGKVLYVGESSDIRRRLSRKHGSSLKQALNTYVTWKTSSCSENANESWILVRKQAISGDITTRVEISPANPHF